MANNCIKLLLLTSEQNLCEMALIDARNGAVCYHHDSKEICLLLCHLLPHSPTTELYMEHGLAFPRGPRIASSKPSFRRCPLGRAAICMALRFRFA